MSRQVFRKQTPKLSGADIANICNEAALIAARKGKKSVGMADFNDAIDWVVGRISKIRQRSFLDDEKNIVAFTKQATQR
ncbi:MAG: hypothetical protein R2788_21680 [Saprospiraceae bacterium]